MSLSEGVDAGFRKKYGIPPKGKGPHPASAYGLPLPPQGHPAAVPFARAVLSRAGQAKNFDPADIAKQVRKAKAILSAHATEAVVASALAPLTEEEALKNAPIRTEVSEEAKAAPIMRTETAFAIREDGDSTSDTAVIKNVLIIRSGPGNLGDRNFYSPAALEAAVASKIFEGARAFLDHPTEQEEREQPGRSVKNMGGWFSATYTAPYNDPELGISSTGLWGDFHPQVGRHDVASLIRTCAEYAKMYPHKAYVGLSISAHGIGAPDEINGEPWNRIDEITYVESVDIVTRAGAGGGFLPLRESFKMAATRKTRTTKDGDGIGLLIDPAKLEEGAKAIRAELKTGILSLLEGGKVKLTPEQDQMLDKHLGIIDGGKIDNVVDAATGVDPDANTESKESAAKEDDVEESAKPDPEDPFREGMSDDEKLKAWPKAAAMWKSAKKAKESAATMMTDAKKLQESATRTMRETHVDSVLAELNLPDSYVPRLRRELLESSSKTRDEFKTRAQEFDAAYVRPLTERAGAFGSAGSGSLPKMTFEYSEA